MGDQIARAAHVIYQCRMPEGDDGQTDALKMRDATAVARALDQAGLLNHWVAPVDNCWCANCAPPGWARFHVCPDCGDKRCPRAVSHTNTCKSVTGQ